MNDQEQDILESASRELEASIADDNQQVAHQDLGKSIVQAISDGVKSVLAKAGGPTTDLPADKDKRGSLLEAGSDPAKSPKKSGKGYDDSSKYEARKGHDMGEEDEDGDEDDKDMPAFFKKKGKKKMIKKMKKSYSDEELESEEGEESDVDATEFMNDLGEAVEHLHKSVSSIEEGVAVFGELLAEMADTRRDKLLVNMAKGINLLITENKELKKSMNKHETMMKSISNLPGMPKVVGTHFAAQEAATTEGESAQVSTADRDRLFQLAVAKKITTGEMQKAIRTGDMSVL